MRIRSSALITGLLLFALTGCSKSEPARVVTTPPVTKPPVTTPAPNPAPGSTTPAPSNQTPATPAPGTPSSLNEQVAFKDSGKVRAAIAAPSPVNYHVINVGPITGDKDAYLDDLMAKSGLPAANDLVLVIFSADGHDIRFAMGSVFHQKGVKVDEILTMVREQYLPQARKGSPEDGIVALVNAVNARMQ